MTRPHLRLAALLAAALGCADLRPATPPDEDLETGQLALRLLDPGFPATAELITQVDAGLRQRTWEDGHLAVAVAAADRARRLGEAELGLSLWTQAAAYVDAHAERLPGHAAYVAYRLDQARTLRGERGGAEHVARLQAWLAAARRLEANGPALAPPAPVDVGEPIGRAVVAAWEASQLGRNPGLRAWHPLWALGEVALDGGDAAAAADFLGQARADASAAAADPRALDARRALALTRAGDPSGAPLARSVIDGAVAASAAAALPADAMAALDVLALLGEALPDDALAEALSAHAPGTPAGTALRIWALALGRPESLAAWAADPATSWFAVEPAWMTELPAAARVPAAVYLPTLAGGDAAQARRNLAYVALYHDAAARVDAGDAASLDAILADLTAIAGALDPEARAHEAAWPGAVADLMRRARSFAAAHGRGAAFDSPPLAAWIGGL